MTFTRLQFLWLFSLYQKHHVGFILSAADDAKSSNATLRRQGQDT